MRNLCLVNKKISKEAQRILYYVFDCQAFLLSKLARTILARLDLASCVSAMQINANRYVGNTYYANSEEPSVLLSHLREPRGGITTCFEDFRMPTRPSYFFIPVPEPDEDEEHSVERLQASWPLGRKVHATMPPSPNLFSNLYLI